MQEITRAHPDASVQDDIRSTTHASFSEVISAWDDPLCCQSDQSPRQCRNRATWIAIQHDPCGHKLVCTYHYKRWLKKSQQLLVANEEFGCPRCSGTFTSIEQFGRFQRL